MNVFERYLTVWVAVCMVAGVVLGKLFPVLVEVPVMLSVCGICNRTRHWFVR
jgi:ACR3 family arsenite transporter